MQSIFYYIKYPNEFIGGVLVKLNRLFPNDVTYLKLIFKCFMGRKLNLDNPQTFSEKLQWLKLYNRKPEYTQMVDKYAVKEYVANIIGKEYIIPTLGVWDRVEDIDFDALPNQFVLKTTHAGGGNGVVICRDKSQFDYKAAQKKLNKSMKTNPYFTLREWPYKNVPHRIIAEQYIDNGDKDLFDYKFFCFNGEPRLCQLISGRESKMCIDFYDKKWNHQPFHEPKIYPFSKHINKVPENYEKMWNLSEILSKNIPFVRIDFYEVNSRVYFGEITFFPTSGIGGFDPIEWDYTFGSWIILPSKKYKL